MDNPPKAIGVIELVTRSLNVYKKSFGRLIGYALLAFAAYIVLGLVFMAIAAGTLGNFLQYVAPASPTQSLGGVNSGHVGGSLAIFFVLSIIIFVAFIVVALLSFAAMTLTIDRTYNSTALNSWGGVLKEGWRSVWRIFLTGLLKTLVVVAPLFITVFLYAVIVFALTASGSSSASSAMNIVKVIFGLAGLYSIFHIFYFGFRLAFSELSTVLENNRPTDSLRRSSTLIKGRWWGTFGRLFGAGLLVGLFVWIVGLILQAGMTSDNQIISAVFLLLRLALQLLTAPFNIIFLVILFNEYRKMGSLASAAASSTISP